ncbi:MAG: class III extradiol dioxygenase family protein [Proteobacteria bacterium]|nr:class III extradiol dioxygenase family protein [Pseudomonadota bacterium]
MARIAAGIGASHVPSVGQAFDRGKQETPEWKPLFDAYRPVQSWLADDIKPDVAIIVYNDHACDFSFDKYPTFAVGAADSYAIADEGFGIRPLPPVRGNAELSWHLCRHLIYEEEFDITVCQKMAVEHGLLVPMNLCFDHRPDWNIEVVPIQVNVLQHPLPTAARCFKLGQALRRAIEAYPKDLNVVVIGTGGMSHQLHGERFGYMNARWDEWFLDTIETDPAALCGMTHHELMKSAGAEAVELIMWLTMRGALTPAVRCQHRHYYAPMTTGMGLITLQDQIQ